MPSYNDQGIILKSFNLSEADKILNIYTKENGLVRCIAKGAKKPSGKFSGRTDLLYCSFFQFAKGKNLDTLCDIEQITTFPKLRSSSNLLFYGILFLDIVNNFAQEEEEESNHIFELLYSMLDELQTSKSPEIVAIRFIIQFLSLHGLKPQLETCVACSKEIVKSKDTYPYSSILGGLLCDECLAIDHISISNGILDILSLPTIQTNNDMETKRGALKLLQKHINTRAKKEVKTFDLVFSL